MFDLGDMLTCRLIHFPGTEGVLAHAFHVLRNDFSRDTKGRPPDNIGAKPFSRWRMFGSCFCNRQSFLSIRILLSPHSITTSTIQPLWVSDKIRDSLPSTTSLYGLRTLGDEDPGDPIVFNSIHEQPASCRIKPVESLIDRILRLLKSQAPSLPLNPVLSLVPSEALVRSGNNPSRPLTTRVITAIPHTLLTFTS